MSIYTYTATDGSAAMVNGTLIADTPREARNRLRDQGLSVHQIAEDTQPASLGQHSLGSLLAGAFRRQPDTSTFLRELSTLLEVGAPMLEALDTTLRSSKKGLFTKSLLKLRERVAAGTSLAEAMEDARIGSRPIFDSVTLNINNTHSRQIHLRAHDARQTQRDSK